MTRTVPLFDPGHVLDSEPEAIDMVNHPPHYISKTGLETIEVMEAYVADMESAAQAMVLKYICRYRNKNGLEDLKKCRWWLNYLIDILEKKGEQNV